MTHNPENILARIEQGLRLFELPAIEPMQGDQWLLASAMQKAIRRGEVNTALRAGRAFGGTRYCHLATCWQQKIPI